MCFSAEADLVTGVVISAVGIDACRHVRRPAERLLAAIPLVLGAHQLTEAFVWWGLEGQVGHGMLRFFLWLYLAIAFGLLPILVPLAVGSMEPAPDRRRIAVFTVIGAVVAVTLMHSVIRGPVDASINGHHIDYRVELWHGGIVVMLYVVATCGALLASHHRRVRWFGAINIVAVGALAWIDQTAFISLWCTWAAITSVAIAVHLRAGRPGRPVSVARPPTGRHPIGGHVPPGPSASQPSTRGWRCRHEFRSSTTTSRCATNTSR